MSSPAYRMNTNNRLWHNHSGFMLLTLCPLLAVSNSVVKSLGLGLVTLAVLAGSSLLVSLLRHQLSQATRLLIIVILVAALTSCAEFFLQAYTFKLYQSLGLFVPLIATNYMLFDRADNFASTHQLLPALLDAMMKGAAFMLLLLVLGAIREVLGTGALFANMDQLLPDAASWKVQVLHNPSPFLLASVPAGALLLLGFLIALKNMIDKYLTPVSSVVAVEPVAGSRRVRVTGKIL